MKTTNKTKSNSNCLCNSTRTSKTSNNKMETSWTSIISFKTKMNLKILTHTCKTVWGRIIIKINNKIWWNRTVLSHLYWQTKTQTRKSAKGRIQMMDKLMIKLVFIWKTTWSCAVYKLKEMNVNSWWIHKVRYLTWTDNLLELPTQTSWRNSRKRVWMVWMKIIKCKTIISIMTYPMVKTKKKWCFLMMMTRWTKTKIWIISNSFSE